MKRILLIVLCLMAVTMRSQQWEIVSPVTEGVILTGGCCNGDGNYVFGAFNKMVDDGYSGALAMFVGNDGSYVEKRFLCEGYKANFCQGICLDDGNAFVVGVKGGTLGNHVFDSLWIAVMTPDLEIVEEHCCPIGSPYATWTGEVYLDFNNDGDVVVLAGASRFVIPYQMTNGVYVVLKCDVQGNVKCSRYFTEGHAPNGARPTGIVRVPGSEQMMMLGKGFSVNGNHTLAYIDNDLELTAAYNLPWLEDNWNHTDCWKENGHFLMSSLTHHHNMLVNQFYAAVFEVDAMGHYIDTLVYDRADTSDYTAQYGSMARFSDEAIYVATYWENGDNEISNDAVMCLIDNDLNLIGTKKLRYDDMKIRLLHCQVTDDGGCLVYGKAKICHGDEAVAIWKLMPDDFVVPWTLTDGPVVPYLDCVYPNPTGDNLNIDLDVGTGRECRVKISDLRGRKYFDRKFATRGGRLTVDVAAFGSGTYVYEVVVDGKSTMKGKFIKN